MNLSTIEKIIIVSFGIFFLLAIARIPYIIADIHFLTNGKYSNSEYPDPMANPVKISLRMLFDFIKITGFLYLINSLYRFKKLKHVKILLLLIVLFLLLDLPMHKCYNGNLESYWELGTHFH